MKLTDKQKSILLDIIIFYKEEGMADNDTLKEIEKIKEKLFIK